VRSSVRAHLAGKDDGLVTVRPVLDRVSCFADLLLEDRDEAFAALRRAESTGRPVGTAEFVTGLERVLGRRIARRAPAPAPAASVSAKQLKLLVRDPSPYLRPRISDEKQTGIRIMSTQFVPVPDGSVRREVGVVWGFTNAAGSALRKINAGPDVNVGPKLRALCFHVSRERVSVVPYLHATVIRVGTIFRRDCRNMNVCRATRDSRANRPMRLPNAPQAA
jgi:hypothetical protein